MNPYVWWYNTSQSSQDVHSIAFPSRGVQHPRIHTHLNHTLWKAGSKRTQSHLHLKLELNWTDIDIQNKQNILTINSAFIHDQVSLARLEQLILQMFSRYLLQPARINQCGIRKWLTRQQAHISADGVTACVFFPPPLCDIRVFEKAKPGKNSRFNYIQITSNHSTCLTQWSLPPPLTKKRKHMKEYVDDVLIKKSGSHSRNAYGEYASSTWKRSM